MSLPLVEYRPCDCFGRTSIHTVFVVLYTMSWGPAYAWLCIPPSVSEEQLPMVQVTPYIIRITQWIYQSPPTEHPTPVAWRWWLRSSVYTYIIQQWWQLPLDSFHLNNRMSLIVSYPIVPHSCSLYQKITNFTICHGTFLSNSFISSV